MSDKRRLYRVRVIKRVEVWEEALSGDAQQAELEVSLRPGVISVFKGSTVLGDRPVLQSAAGVEDGDGT